ncbi:hypothetical protein Sste5346_003255 [Sporothrix stenoceras]|uniref:Uncharacterized protein n=1 Tax=Sporothrix stenoceras TaxID=5173 RepID=A0ABR3ZFK1_9PEZI
MVKSSIGGRFAALVPTDNCSVADTSIDDHRTEKKPSRETSPAIKHKSLQAPEPNNATAANENWRPHVSTVTEKSTGSTDSADSMSSPLPPKTAETKGKGKSAANPNTNTNDVDSRHSPQPRGHYGAQAAQVAQALACIKARFIAELEAPDNSSADLATDSADSMPDPPPKTADVKGKSAAKPKTKDVDSRRTPRPRVDYGEDALANLIAHIEAEEGRDGWDVLNEAIGININSETGGIVLMKPLEPTDSESNYATKEAYLRSMAELPLFFIPDPEYVEKIKSSGKSGHRHPPKQNPDLFFSLPSQSRLPPYAMLQSQPRTHLPQDSEGWSRNPLENHPAMPFLSPRLQDIARKCLRPECGQEGREVADFIMNRCAGSENIEPEPFVFPTSSRLPPYGNIRPSSPAPRHDTLVDGDDDLAYAEGTDGSFSFSQGVPARLPLHMIAGAEASQMALKADRCNVQMDKLERP